MVTLSETARSILIIEDDSDSLALLFHTFTNAGYKVIAVDGGQPALNVLEGGIVPCIFIVDLMMPRVSGFDVLKHVSDDPALRHVPVIVTSALPRQDIRVVADAVFEKPYDHFTVVDTVRRLVGNCEPN